MGRASGRKNLPRAPQVSPDSPEGREIGESARQDPAGSPIPGLTGNIANYETVRQKVPVGDPLPEFRGMMAHGVPPEDTTTEERAQAERGGSAPHQPPAPPKLHKAHLAPPPVPVYVVNPAEGGRPIRTLATQKITIPAAGNAPARICGRDETRETMYVLVETAAGTTATDATSLQNSGSTGTSPAAGTTVTSVTNVPAGTYTVAWSVGLGGTTSATDISNFELFNGASGVLISASGSGSGSFYPQEPVTITVAANATVSVQVVANATTGAVYRAQLVLTPVAEITTATAAPSGIRIDHEVGTLDVGLGALLRAGMTSYQELKGCQDELFGVSNDGSACTLSVIFLYGIPAGG